jgi:hypothetical protein
VNPSSDKISEPLISQKRPVKLSFQACLMERSKTEQPKEADDDLKPTPESLIRRALCEGCFESVTEGQLARRGGRRLCASCAALADKAKLAGERSGSGLPPAAGETRSIHAAPTAHAGIRAWIASCCANRYWLPRVPFLILFSYILARHLGDPGYQSIFKPLNLGIHELGHYVFMPLGKFLEIAGGTILQCLVPVAAMGMFLRQRDLFAIAVSLGWLGTSFFDVAIYAGDARAMGLPLVSPGGGHVIHDWNYLLGRLGILESDKFIARGFQVAATCSMAICLAAGIWLLWLMARSPKTTGCTE